MTKPVLLLLTLVTFSACRQIEKITSTRTERIDSVAVQVPIDRHVLDVPFLFSDSILVEDERLRVRIVPIDDSTLSPELEGSSKHGVVESDKSSAVDSSLKRYRLIAEIKPDTQEVKVAEKTITETKKTIKYERKIPWWGTLLIGGLIAVVLVLLVARKLQ